MDEKEKAAAGSSEPEELSSSASSLEASVEAVRKFLAERFGVSDKAEAAERIKVGTYILHNIVSTQNKMLGIRRCFFGWCC